MAKVWISITTVPHRINASSAESLVELTEEGEQVEVLTRNS
jgi:hypothetical protein